MNEPTVASAPVVRSLAELSVAPGAMMENPSLGIFVSSLDGTVHEMNDAFLAMLGYDRAEAHTINWQRATPPEYRELHGRMIAACIADGRTPLFEKVYVGKDGTRVPVLLGASVLDRTVAPEAIRMVVHALDLRGVTRARYEQTRDRDLVSLAQSIPHIVWRTDAAGANDFFNEEWTAFTGLSPEESRGAGWLTPIHPDDLAAAAAAWERTIRDELPYDITFRIRAKSGTYAWFLTRATALRDETGRVVRYFGTCTNVDEQKRAAEMLALVAALNDALATTRTLADALDAVALVIVAEGYAQRAVIVPEAHTDGATTLAAADGIALQIPLAFGANRFGAIRLQRRDGEPYAPEEVALLTNVAERIAPLIASAEVYERERRIATTFQNAVLPASLPRIASLAFDALYEAGRDEATVGGDWYDAYGLPDGRCVVAIGDVSGSGLDAAVIMAEIRQTMRGAAAVDADPVVMLEAADRVVAERAGARFATAWVGIIDPLDLSIVYAGAGHPAPLRRSAEGTVGALDGGGLPIGLRALGGATAAREATLAAGDALVLFTDGITEASRDVVAGLAALTGFVARTEPLSARAIRNAVLPFENAQDDIAILVVRIAQAPTVRRRWAFDARDAAAGRRFLREIDDEFVALGADGAARHAAQTVAAELVGNVVRHAAGAIRIVLDREDDHAVLHVVDEGVGFRFDPRLPRDATSERGRGLYLVSRLCAAFAVMRRRRGGSHARAVLRLRLGETKSPRTAT